MPIRATNLHFNRHFYKVKENEIGVQNGTNLELLTNDKSFVGAINELVGDNEVQDDNLETLYLTKINGLPHTYTGPNGGINNGISIDLYDYYFDVNTTEGSPGFLKTYPTSFWNSKLDTNTKEGYLAINEIHTELDELSDYVYGLNIVSGPLIEYKEEWDDAWTADGKKYKKFSFTLPDNYTKAIIQFSLTTTAVSAGNFVKITAPNGSLLNDIIVDHEFQGRPNNQEDWFQYDRKDYSVAFNQQFVFGDEGASQGDGQGGFYINSGRDFFIQLESKDGKILGTEKYGIIVTYL